MKPSLLLFMVLSFSAFTLKAQKPDAAQVLVHYKFSHLQDTTKRDSFYRENMILLAGKNASVYKSLDRQMRDIAMRKQLKEQMANAIATGGPIKMNSSDKARGTAIEFYQFAAEKKLIRKENVINNYLVEEQIPVLNWKITKDTASFSGLHCQKAFMHFKGRDYIAWFCPDLPYHSGPWLLNGLPGLIIEAADVKNEVIFKFDGLEDVSKGVKSEESTADNNVSMVKIVGADDTPSDLNLIVLPANGVKATEAELARLKEARRKDPRAFAQSAMAASGISFTVTSSTPVNVVNKAVTGNIPVVNNPVELPEKK